MNSERKAAALILLSGLIAGCQHKAKTAPPAAAQAPIAPVSTIAKNTTPPQLPPAQLPKVNPPAPPVTVPPPQPHKTVHHKPKPTETAPADQSPTPTAAKDQGTGTSQAVSQTGSQGTTEQAAANGTGGDPSPIGQLSAAGESTNTPRRNQISDEITSTEKGLNDIKRSLSADEQTTATQIRTFLAKAKDALNQEDLDGALTLVTKARVLLDELTKP
jgi:hypothetical protein